MKNIIKYILYLIIYICSFNVFLCYAQKSHTVNFRFDDFLISEISEDDNIQCHLKWGNNLNYPVDGNYSIPAKIITIRLPQYCKNLQLKNLSKHIYSTQQLSYPLEKIQYQINNTVFSSDRKDDSKSIGATAISNEYILHGNEHYCDIIISPFEYDSISKSLISFDRIDFDIFYEECSADDMNFVIFDKSKSGRVQSTDNFYTIPEKNNYVIITTDNLKDACQKLAVWKMQKGYNVIIKSIDEILTQPDFMVGINTIDAADAVREYLKTIYNPIVDNYCIFVGDVDNGLPMRYFYYLNDRKETNNDLLQDNFIPSDLYFCDLSRKWEYRQEDNGTYTIKLTNIEYSPSMYVGRLMCKTSQEIDNYIYKLKIYEAYPGRGDVSYLNNALVFKQNKQISYRNIIDLLNIYDEENIIRLYDNKAFDFNLSKPIGADIINAMSRVGLASWQGHGGPATVACSGKNGDYDNWRYIQALSTYGREQIGFGTPELNNGLDLIDNIDYPSIVYSISCDIAPFDNCYHKNIPYNIGSAFTVANKNGGVALLGNSRSGYGDNFEASFTQNVEKYNSLGKAHAYTRKTCTFDKYVITTQNVIGDPEFSAWLKAPETLHKYSIEFKDNIFQLIGDGLSESKVVLYDGENINYLVFNSDIKYNISELLQHSCISNNCFAISIWKPNCLPFLEFYGYDTELKNCNKTFSVRNATLGIPGNNIDSTTFFTIGEHASIKISTLQNIKILGNVTIEDAGFAEFSSDDETRITGMTVKSGGSFIVNAGAGIKITNKFKVEKGATVLLKNK